MIQQIYNLLWWWIQIHYISIHFVYLIKIVIIILKSIYFYRKNHYVFKWFKIHSMNMNVQFVMIIIEKIIMHVHNVYNQYVVFVLIK